MLSNPTVPESRQNLPSPFSGNVLRNIGGHWGTGMGLDLFGLPAHSSVEINFLFAFIDSWDSDNGTVSPDYFMASIDFSTVLTITAANASGSHTYAGTSLGTGNFGWSGWIDRAFDMAPESALSIPHSGSTLFIYLWAAGGGFQGGDDESWAIDNFNVVVDTTDAPQTPVPQPGTILLLASGLVGLGFVIRRR
jgi:hypothetical protein